MRLRKNDFDRVHSIEQKKEVMKHKERVEALYRQKLEDEKRKMNKGRIDEFDEMVQENRSMKDAAALRGLLTSQVLFAYLSDIDDARHDEFIQAAGDAVIGAAQAVPGSPKYDVEYVRIVAAARKPL